MKKIIIISIKNILILASILVSVISCTEIIDIDLNSSDPQIVIEGTVSTNGEPTVIKITKSVNFDETNDFPLVQNALVEIFDNTGNSEFLTETSPGLYSSNTFTGISGRTYFMNVETNDKSLSSSCLIPNHIAFDSLIVKESDGQAGGPGSGSGGFGSTTNYDVTVKYQDPANETNYYRFVEIVNGTFEESYVFDDRISNGLSIESSLVRFDRHLEKGDTIQVIMQCIDKAVFDYFNSFGNLMGGPGNSSTPANPNTNIEGAKLGYFSAHTYELKQEVIE